MQRYLSFLLFMAAGGVLTGCSTDPIVCPAESALAVEVEPQDAFTGDPIADVTRGVALDGSYVDSLRAYQLLSANPVVPRTLGGAADRAGTYAVHLEAEGYTAWDTSGLVVRRNACTVETVSFIARLTPAP